MDHIEKKNRTATLESGNISSMDAIIKKTGEQQEKDVIIERQLRFQKLLMSISTKYINADVSDIDDLIQKSLQQIGEFVEADRSYIFSYDFIKNTTSNTYEWCAEGIEPEIHNLQEVPVDFIPQWLEAHKKGKSFYVEDVAQLPEDGEYGLRAILEPQGVKSLITIPEIKNNELIGFVGFDSVRKINQYTQNEQDILFVYANMLVNVLLRKESEERIAEQEAKKEELLQHLSQQNQELNEYAHAVSHDLKAPLINIYTLITWFLDDHKATLPESSLKPLYQVQQNVEKMDHLIKGILDYATIDQLTTADRDIDLRSLLEEVMETLLVPAHIKAHIQEKWPSMHGNDWRLKQLFQNLIQNAIKYNDKDQGKITVGSIEKYGDHEFFVKDNGLGIHPDHHERIFQVFTKLDHNNASSGVGLSIVKKIVNHYKGNIWLQSKEGEGTTFYFTLKGALTKAHHN